MFYCSKKRKLDNELRFEILEEKVLHLQTDLRKMKKKLKVLEEGQITSTPTKPKSVYEELRETLITNIESKTTWQAALEAVIYKIFTEDDLKNCSLSGKKTNKCGEDGPRPAIDQDKLALLYDIILQRYQNATRKNLMEKVQNIQKVLRKKEMKKEKKEMV